MIKNYIIDTNVMVHDPDFIYNFEDNNIIIPIICIEELDNLKKREGIVGYHARSAAREINNLRETGNLHEGIKLANGGTIRIELNNNDPSCLPNGFDFTKNDTKILAITKNIKESNKEISTILVTKDLYMAIKSDALGIVTQDYKNDKITANELYKGYRKMILTSKKMDEIKEGGIAMPSNFDFTLYPNEFLDITSSDDSEYELIGKFNGKAIVPLKYVDEFAFGLKPINKEQKMAFELLMDPKIQFVTISGGAGSGKTIMSTAVALKKVIEEGAFRRVIFVKPVIPAGDDIGFLPGTEEEKLKPWMGSFYDAIENLMDAKEKTKNDKNKEKKSKKIDEHEIKRTAVNVDNFIEKFRQSGQIETKTFVYMRGRTLSDALVIVDESQQTTPHLAKLMLTRAGFGSKFVFIGDPSDNQIDNILVDEKSNGLVYTIEKMKPFDITGHVTLEHVERSPLSKLAERSM
ncbi:PhoH family protein [Clostridium estertheticum]|uniref:PhoH family protein n=1 Tax=Clostridium estertheticum TaxID=238834 RepID=A0A7Y3WRW1_9CLOT|nr:PhoH family protein [Clostridium estertheticum]NNU75314.1 PhoH family protein [Clostridium estertheticum]WBL48217.1 PhoH family protein [Clostridium estertheticum]